MVQTNPFVKYENCTINLHKTNFMIKLIFEIRFKTEKKTFLQHLTEHSVKPRGEYFIHVLEA